MNKKVMMAVLIFVYSGSLHTELSAQDQLTYEQDLYASAGLTDDAAGMHEDYDMLCNTIPQKPMPRWQQWLAVIGTPFLTGYIAIRTYFETKIRQVRRFIAQRIMWTYKTKKTV
jgi:hypothetical protein